MPTLVFAPDSLVRFRDGKVLLHNTRNPLPAFETDNPMLIGWLCQFSRPVDTDRLLASLQLPDKESIARVIDYLLKSGVLIAAETPPTPIAAEALSHESKHYLRLLARNIYETSCDLNALDTEADARLQARSGIGIQKRLMALIAAVDGLRTELAELSKDQVAKQLAALQVDTASRHLKLHIGCGKGHLTGWINIDVHPAPLALNVLRGLPFEAKTVSHVFVSHLLEHLYFPGDVRPFLAELRRVMEPDAIVRMVVPDVEKCIEAYSTSDRAFFANRRETWDWWPENATRLEDFLAYAGAGPEPSYLFEAHKYGYDFETLAKALKEAGFDSIAKSEYMQSTHEALRVDAASAVAKAKYGDRYYSLFVEARTP